MAEDHFLVIDIMSILYYIFMEMVWPTFLFSSFVGDFIGS